MTLLLVTNVYGVLPSRMNILYPNVCAYCEQCFVIFFIPSSFHLNDNSSKEIVSYKMCSAQTPTPLPKAHPYPPADWFQVPLYWAPVSFMYQQLLHLLFTAESEPRTWTTAVWSDPILKRQQNQNKPSADRPVCWLVPCEHTSIWNWYLKDNAGPVDIVTQVNTS